MSLYFVYIHKCRYKLYKHVESCVFIMHTNVILRLSSHNYIYKRFIHIILIL